MKRPGWAKGGTRIVVRPFFEPRDLWRGVYWNYEYTPPQDENGYAFGYQHQSHSRLTLWIGLLPMLIIRIDLVAKERTDEGKVRRD